jgi:hypothetical protein
LREELVAMVGDGVYELIAGYLDARRAPATRRSQAGVPVRVPHPAVRQASG